MDSYNCGSNSNPIITAPTMQEGLVHGRPDKKTVESVLSRVPEWQATSASSS